MNRSVVINFGGIIGVIVMVLLLFLAFQAFKFLYMIGLYLLPVTLIIAFFVRRQVVKDHFLKMVRPLKDNLLTGMLNLLVQLVLLPFSAMWLIVKGTLYNKSDEMQKQFEDQYQRNYTDQSNVNGNQLEGEYIDYEDLEVPQKEEKNDYSKYL